MLHEKTIAFIGAGSMAEAMISGIVAAGKVPSKQIFVTNRTSTERLQQLESVYKINGLVSQDLPLKSVDIIVLAMKPKDAGTALQSIKDSLQPNQLVLSVLAGITTSYMEQHLPAGQQVIRVMPNTSSMIGESATAISAGSYTTHENMFLAKELLKSIGEVYEISEDQMDVFTGVAGSGPAYIYYLMEHMEATAKKLGLQEKISRDIIAQTIVGAAKMIQQQGETPSTLRENVTSPNGTTAAGLAALEKNGGDKAISQAIKHAAKRSHEISSQLEGKTAKKVQAV
ncbi:pyrroline-5-carboxylate reductase [Fredinandcohnia sp. QZ13]|uniref:pyrroline-5-carboxylate reductase n=1 Tax=Fredinandcohnia sp. QZ13 TaxID=3073144 RepID=UPI0028537113|nr:pyrroline-5-carboxylate reductase [Fredinandcohnia sp. QZ13]MDR4888307.1 pyrroline-5-carboxylate reductase [Fredinandcohnia sp. QZ13]